MKQSKFKARNINFRQTRSERSAGKSNQGSKKYLKERFTKYIKF